MGRFVNALVLILPVIAQCSHLSQREELLAEDASFATGSQIQLEGKEWAVNDVLMSFKGKEIEKGVNTSVYPPNMHFFQAKPLIEQSEVFKIIKLMPKGASLHLHADSITDIDWLVKNVTYRPHCYMCYTKNGGMLLFRFSEEAPPDDEQCSWNLVASERAAAANASLFDEELYRQMTLVVDDPHTAYTDQNNIWTHFLDYFAINSGLVNFADVVADRYYEGLRQFHEDGVQFVEVRSDLAPLYELNGTTHDEEYVIKTLEAANRAFLADYADSMGFKVITSQVRAFTKPEMESRVRLSIDLRRKYPDFVSGFDIDGHENKPNPLVHFLEELQIPSQEGVDLPYYLHASETNWQGTFADENLFDALLLNAVRIGHAYAAIKHPVLLKQIRDRDIPIEISPISGQVLMHFPDLRNHPGAYLLSHGYPVVVTSDNRACWGASPASHDYYEMFMGIASAKADLRLLKQLTRDSIKYSSLSDVQKVKCNDIWTSKWNDFLDQVLEMYNVTNWEDYIPPESTQTTRTPVVRDTASSISLSFTFVVLMSVFLCLRHD
ncbi:adenosine deaminase 2-like [Ptychodera flava]|uniref:adenosine deaminase 2-like n=1 Tax=Ptychodera flava TaxID=63121 RepID=UPI00396A1A74